MASTVALSMLLPSPSEASESHERSWGLSAPERLGIALGLGFSKRMDEPPDFPIDAAKALVQASADGDGQDIGGLLRVLKPRHDCNQLSDVGQTRFRTLD